MKKFLSWLKSGMSYAMVWVIAALIGEVLTARQNNDLHTTGYFIMGNIWLAAHHIVKELKK